MNISMAQVPVVETFYSVQGEGASLGRPALFIRMAGCNLFCHWCDSVPASRWKPEHPGWKPLAKALSSIPDTCDRVVLTGGEPLLHPLDQVVEYVESLAGRPLIVEVESNGTIFPSDAILRRVSQWNLSPKLARSQFQSVSAELLEGAIPRWVAYRRDHAQAANVWFKFVVGTIREFEEVTRLVARFAIPRERVFCMREGIRRVLFENDPWNLELVDLCKDHGFNYSTRLHILLWDGKTGC